MKNTLNKLPFYKGTSVMIIENSIGVSFGEANPFIQFKFAPRADHKSQGQWDEANCFWITSYVELFSFVNGMNLVATGKMEKYEMKNPKKGCNVQIRASTNTQSNTDYITFNFFRGDVKINVSLIKATEYVALFAYYKNLLDNYNTVCATALFRNDFYYVNFVKGKENNQKSGQNSGGYTNNSNSNSSNSSNKYNQNKNAPNKNNQQQYKEPDLDGAVSSIEDEINDMNNGFGGGFTEDVPF